MKLAIHVKSPSCFERPQLVRDFLALGPEGPAGTSSQLGAAFDDRTAAVDHASKWQREGMRCFVDSLAGVAM